MGRQGEVRRQKNDRNGGPAAAHFGSYLPPAEARHVEVEHNQVNLVLVEESYPLLPIAGGEHLETMVLQHDLSHSQTDGLVVNTEHRLLASCVHPSLRFFQRGFNSQMRTAVGAAIQFQGQASEQSCCCIYGGRDAISVVSHDN